MPVTDGRRDSRTGLVLASLILISWLGSLVILLSRDAALLPLPVVVLVILVRTFLHTGLFIVAHDAMHGSLAPASRPINDQLGRLSLFLYAGLPYGLCRSKHLQHHLSPGRSGDPDFHAGIQADPVRWYIAFMAAYLSTAQMATLLLTWGASTLALSGWQGSMKRAVTGILLFWIAPLLLSSIQLFTFGTYLPHRPRGRRPLMNRHRARSIAYPTPLSLLACYHFGYHWEHHECPQSAWYRLPAIRSRKLMAAIGTLSKTAPKGIC